MADPWRHHRHLSNKAVGHDLTPSCSKSSVAESERTYYSLDDSTTHQQRKPCPAPPPPPTTTSRSKTAPLLATQKKTGTNKATSTSRRSRSKTSVKSLLQRTDSGYASAASPNISPRPSTSYSRPLPIHNPSAPYAAVRPRPIHSSSGKLPTAMSAGGFTSQTSVVSPPVYFIRPSPYSKSHHVTSVDVLPASSPDLSQTSYDGYPSNPSSSAASSTFFPFPALDDVASRRTLHQDPEGQGRRHMDAPPMPHQDPQSPMVQRPPQTVHYWTSDRTRRLEYAAIDAASRGFKGWVRRNLVPPGCFGMSSEDRHVAFDDDTGSVRRYRLDLEEEVDAFAQEKKT